MPLLSSSADGDKSRCPRRASRAKHGVVGRRDHRAEQVDGGGGPCPGQQATVRFRQRPLEVSGVELGGEGMQDGLGELVETARSARTACR